MRCGIVVFPGSNCDHDVYHVLKHVLQQDVTFLWHQDDTLKGCELAVLPGGFAYGGFCGAGECEAAIKKATAATVRVLPDPEFCSSPAPTTCMWCGKPSVAEAVWAQAY